MTAMVRTASILLVPMLLEYGAYSWRCGGWGWGWRGPTISGTTTTPSTNGGGGDPPSAALSSWATACEFGRLLVVKDGLEVNEKRCDWIYPKEDWQPPQPQITYSQAKEDEIYTVFCIDPDAPAHPIGSYYLHMLQANIKGSDLKKADFSKALTIASYVGPAPPVNTGFHRYMFMVYKHKPKFRIQNEPTPERLLFNLTKYLSKQGRGLTGPEAGVQFQSSF